MITLCPAVLNLLRSAILIKSTILLLILISSLLPDHNADAFNPPQTPSSNYLDHVIRHVFQGFRKWDSIYFTFVAQWGYVYEQSLAFFPLLPLLLGLIARFAQILTAYLFSLETLILITGLCMNFCVNLINTLLLYRLTRQILHSPKLSFLTALMFCLNPASVFFSSLYSESLFFMFTCLGLIALDSGHPIYCSLLFALSTLCRSNGLINAGFLCFYSIHSIEIQTMLWNSKILEESRKSMIFFLNNAIKWWFNLLYFAIPRLVLLVICVAPYFIYEVFGFLLFCHSNPISSFGLYLMPKPSNQVLSFGTKSGFKMPSFITHPNESSLFEPPLWCNQKLPLFYSAIQSQYWNVGLWRYYDWKQLPNFLLACPVVFLVLSCSSTFYQRAPRAYKTLGFLAETSLDRRLVPHVFHALFLCIYGVTHINVQVITRMIFSSCPIIYWYCAYLLHSNLSPDSEYALDKLSRVSSTSQTHKQRSEPTRGLNRIRTQLHFIWLIFNPWQYNRLRERLLLVYFFGFALLGCILHPNFLPWT